MKGFVTVSVNQSEFRTLIPDTGTHTPAMTLPKKAWVRLNRPAPVSDVSAPACTNGAWPLLRPVSVAQNKPSTMSSSTVQIIDLPRSTRPDGSGR